MSDLIIHNLKKEISDIKNSFSYKLGFFLTFPFRKIYDFIIFSFTYFRREKEEKLLYKSVTNRYKKNNENVIFTFIIDNYDILKDPITVSKGWDYICFTDNESLKSDIWQIIYLTSEDFNNYPESSKKRAMLLMIEYYKYIKKEYRIVISVGAQITINCDLNIIFEEINHIETYDLCICQHPVRNCIYDEAEECKILGKDSKDVIDNQMLRYREEGYPSQNKLYETGLMIRKNNSKELKKICRIWAKELMNGSRRDQLSLNYSIWKSNSKINIFEIERFKLMDRRNDASFIVGEHLLK